MANYDVFNGDADGICALQQLRLAEPCDSILITGVKRDISLLKRVDAGPDDQIVVLDVAMEKNIGPLQTLLAKGVSIRYFDHHFPGEIPTHDRLETHVDTAPECCTSLLVNRYLNGAFSLWAAVGAFGDNLTNTARGLTEQHSINDKQVDVLRRLGEYINYNGYGANVDDLHYKPDELFRTIQPFESPFDFIEQRPEVFKYLSEGYQEDLELARNLSAQQASDHTAIYILPDEAWARRVSGVFANELAKKAPDRAHALLTERTDGSYLVSVRSPINRKEGADTLCLQFETGGGRKAAAGINNLPSDQFQRFIDAFRQAYTQ